MFPELRQVLPTHDVARGEDNGDAHQYFHALCSALKRRPTLSMVNTAMWFSGRTVSTPLHYDEYLTMSFVAGTGKKIWCLAVPCCAPCCVPCSVLCNTSSTGALFFF